MSDMTIGDSAIQMPTKKIDASFKPTSKTQLEKAAKEFESTFMNIVMQSMRQTVGDDNDVFGSSEKEKFFQSMLDDEYSKISSKNTGLGLAAAIVKQLTPRIEAEQKTTNPKDEKPKV